MTSPVELPPGYAIRPVRLDDAGRVAAAYERNRAHLAPWDPARDPAFFTPEGQRAVITAQLDLAARGLLAAWVLERGDEVVGRVALNNIAHGVFRNASVGYWVDGAHVRLGLARAAVRHACAEALSLGLHRLEAGTLLHNVASQRVLIAAGFERYGTAPGYLAIAGRWQDHHLYQRLLHDDPPPGPTG